MVPGMLTGIDKGGWKGEKIGIFTALLEVAEV